jgi:Putative addiction module component
MAQAEEHIRELLKQPVATRALAAQKLIESIEDDPEDPEAEMMQAAELARRARADVDGAAKRVDAEEERHPIHPQGTGR